MKSFLCGLMMLVMCLCLAGCGAAAEHGSEAVPGTAEQQKITAPSYRDVSIEWTQPQVEQAVRGILNKPEGVILGQELEDIRELDLTDAGLWEAQDLKYLTGLETLKLSGNQIQDLSPLEGLIHLKTLELAENDADDLAALAGMKELVHLDLAHNPISDLSPLQGLSKLEWLDCSNHGSGWMGDTRIDYPIDQLNRFAQGLITDASPLSGLTGLKVLRLGGNPIHSLAPLAQLTQLEELDIHCVRARDWSSLSALAALRVLDLSENDIEHIEFLKKHPALEQLDLSGNLVQSLEPLASLPALTDLHIMECGLANYDTFGAEPEVSLWNQLAQLPALKRLWAGNYGMCNDTYRNEPGALFWAEQMPKLEELYLPYSSLRGMSDTLAEFLPSLRVLDLTYSDVKSLEGLRGMSALKELRCGGWFCDRPKDVAVLAELPGLEKLAITWGGYGNGGPDTTPLRQLTQLKELDFFSPECSDFSFLRHMPSLEVLKIKEGDLGNMQDLSGMTALKSLTLQDVNVASLEGLQNCTALTELNLKSKNADVPEEITPLAACKNLEKLWLVNWPTQDLSMLTQLPALRELRLEGYVDIVLAHAGYTVGGSVDTVSIGQIPSLESLRIDGPQVPDIAPLAALPRLRQLMLLSASVPEDLSALSGMTGLQKLELRTQGAVPDLSALSALRELTLDAPMENLKGLQAVTGLCSLTVSNCGLGTLKGAEGMTHLRRLNASSNILAGVSGIANCQELTVLDLRDNNIADLQPLADKEKLRVLCTNLTNSAILEPLAGLPRLNYMDFGYQPVKDIAPLSGFKMLRALTMCAPETEPGFVLDPLSSCTELQALYLMNNLNRGKYATMLMSGLSGCRALRYLPNFYEAGNVLNGFVHLRR